MQSSYRQPENLNTLTAHLGELGRPEMVLESVIRGVGNPRVELDPAELPALLETDQGRKSMNVIIRIVVAESGLGASVQVLSVHKGHSPFDSWFAGHGLEMNNPVRGRCRRVERGVSKSGYARTEKRISQSSFVCQHNPKSPNTAIPPVRFSLASRRTPTRRCAHRRPESELRLRAFA